MGLLVIPKVRLFNSETPLVRLLSKRKTIHLRIALVFVLFSLLITFFSSLVGWHYQKLAISSLLDEREQLEDLHTREAIEDIISSFENTLIAISSSDALDAVLTANQATTLPRLKLRQLFIALAKARPELLQLRYIDQLGHEQVRVNHSPQSRDFQLVLDDQLQDKSQRYYFQETKALQQGEIWHSHVDLNFENGELQRPLQPTMRVATPVYVNQMFRGIIILNIDAGPLIEALKYSSVFLVSLIDAQGELLSHPDPSKSWSAYFPERGALSEVYPELIGELSPALMAAKHNYRMDLEDSFNNQQGLWVLKQPKQHALEELYKNSRYAVLTSTLIILVIALPLAWLVSIYPTNLQTKLVDTLHALRASRKLLDQHIMSSTTNSKGVITEFSSAAAKAFEVDRKSMIGKTHAAIRHPSTSTKVHRDLWDTILAGKPWQGELKNQTSSGKTLWIDTVITPRKDSHGEIYAFTQISHDITLHKAMEALSSTDSLTETHNRRKLDQLLEQQAQRYKRADEEFAIIIIDIDHFKQINDIYGHQAGDKVLIDVAASLKETVRQIDEVGRWGGEEFLVICPLTDLEGAYKLAEKLRAAIATKLFLPDKQITASFGVAQYLCDEATNHLVHRADLALYEAKSQGRNRVTTAPQELAEQAQNNR